MTPMLPIIMRSSRYRILLLFLQMCDIGFMFVSVWFVH